MLGRFRLSFGLLACVIGGAAGQIGKPCFANETAMQLFTEVDLSGKIAVVTGADKGIGLEVAKALAARKATIIPACRKLSEMNETADLIKMAVPGAKVMIPSAAAPLDLSSFAIVRAFVESIAHLPAIDILVNDAAMDNNPHKLTTGDGFEMAFQIDYPSQWLLTHLMLPQLRKAKGRVVNLVSKAYRLACVMSKRFQCMQIDHLPPPVINGTQKAPIAGIPVSNYGIARLLVIRWTEDLAKREAAAGTGVTVYSVNPGFVNTTMARAGNLSPFFKWLSCETEGRPGAPCPTLPSQGALTPTFLALAPGIEGDSGKFFEWCEPAEVSQCMDIDDGPIIPSTCPGQPQEYKDDLWNLTAHWVSNFSAPIVSPMPEVTAELAQLRQDHCPSWLEPLCHSADCVTGCYKELSTCMTDSECRSNFRNMLGCLAEMQKEGKSADDELTCFVPTNVKRDDLFYCMIDEHDCINPGKSNITYPACRDHEVEGDASFKPTHLHGNWWKNQAWSKSEQYECRPCGRVSFSDYHVLPWPVHPPADVTDYSIIASSWRERDINGKWWTVNETSLFGPRPGHLGFPAKEQHVGVMYGLSYLENFTVVHDGSQESEPFFVLYGCGGTKQGTYVTGFAFSKNPTASPMLKARMQDVIAKSGLFEGAWCDVDNSCAAEDEEQGVMIVV